MLSELSMLTIGVNQSRLQQLVVLNEMINLLVALICDLLQLSCRLNLFELETIGDLVRLFRMILLDIFKIELVRMFQQLMITVKIEEFGPIVLCHLLIVAL